MEVVVIKCFFISVGIHKMRIISNFHDYYDAIQQYGIDNKIVFNRVNKNGFKFNTEPNTWFGVDNELPNVNINRLNLRVENRDQKLNDVFDFYCLSRRSYSDIGLYKILAIINAKVYENFIICGRGKFKTLDVAKIITKNPSLEYIIKILNDSSLEPTPQNKKYFRKSEGNDSYTTSEELYGLHKEIKSPVFFIVSDAYRSYSVSNYPLAYFGFSKLYDGNIEYISQEIAYCLGNVLQNNNEPPLKIDDKTKIQQHGFDLIGSFRHRLSDKMER